MRASGGQISEASARGAWVSVGAPILALMLVIVVSAVAAFAGFARQQDEAFAHSSERLVAGSIEARQKALAALLVDYA
ncbi:MAG TPA: hypothetical protein PLS69_12520, partial [Terricaulis sp.]|nr:hypothetical protein [Terricaulis sp.]